MSRSRKRSGSIGRLKQLRKYSWLLRPRPRKRRNSVKKRRWNVFSRQMRLPNWRKRGR